MKRALLVAGLAIVPLANLFPQSSAPPAVLQIARESIKEGKAAAHRKVEQDFVGVYRKHNFPFYYLALSAESGPNEVWFLDAYPSFAALEESDRLGSETPFRDEVDAVEARDGELRASSHSMTAVYRGDLSYLPANPLTIGKTRYVMIATYRLRLGHEEDFKALAVTILSAYKSAMLDASVLVYQVIAGASDGTYLLLSPMASLKDMDDEPARQQALMNAMGADAYRRFMKSSGDVFESMQNALYAVSPDMSYMSKEAEDEDGAYWRPAPSGATAKAKGKGESKQK